MSCKIRWSFALSPDWPSINLQRCSLTRDKMATTQFKSAGCHAVNNESMTLRSELRDSTNRQLVMEGERESRGHRNDTSQHQNATIGTTDLTTRPAKQNQPSKHLECSSPFCLVTGLVAGLLENCRRVYDSHSALGKSRVDNYVQRSWKSSLSFPPFHHFCTHVFQTISSLTGGQDLDG